MSASIYCIFIYLLFYCLVVFIYQPILLKETWSLFDRKEKQTGELLHKYKTIQASESLLEEIFFHVSV